MSQRHPKLIDLDFTPPEGRRNSGPASESNGAGDEGATGEIRTLIDQLQRTANEARHRLSAVENERDSLAQQAELLQEQARELRSRSAESSAMAQQISRLEQQKEDLEVRLTEARALGEIRVATLPSPLTQELEHRLAAAERAQSEARRQHEEIIRQRDQLTKAVEALNRTVHDLNSRFHSSQEQLVNLRQARDGAQNQNRELSQKLERQEDQIADLQYRLEKNAASSAGLPEDAAIQAERQRLQHERDEARKQIDALRAETEAAAAEREDLKRQLEEARQLLEQTRQAALDPAAMQNLLSELQEVTAGRESALAEAVALRTQVERLRQQASQGEGAGAEASDTFRREKEAMLVQVEIATREVVDLREKLNAREADLAAGRAERETIAASAAAAEAQYSVLAADREMAFKARDEALTSLAAAQKQIEHVARERDVMRESGTENAVALSVQLDDLRKAHDALKAAADELRAEKKELSARLDAQRLEGIDLVARVQAAEHQVRTLGASLAEARLQARSGARATAEKPAPPSKSEALMELPAGMFPAGAQELQPPPGAPAPDVLAPFPTSASYDAVRAMRRCYNAYARDPEDLSHLNELHCAAINFADQAREGGCVAVHRVAMALATLMQELYHFPEQITSEVLTSIVQAIEFLTALLKVKDLPTMKDPATGVVCVVDDDAATRECIIMAMEAVMVQTISYEDPAKALCDLGKTSCNLIILDVQMPGMDGFELCTNIRQHAMHKHTPVAFVTGMTGPEVRSRSALCGGTDFLTKPFILAELSLKSLIMMMRADLPLVGI